MAAPATPEKGTLRQRNVPGSKKKVAGPAVEIDDLDTTGKSKSRISRLRSDLDYKFALGVITALAFVSRFWGISHPAEVVFDEVHFGKVS
jgi:dolichyl-phosphate-mannose-protein mannosyltransferase